jgi:uncharacterized protein (DUF305 family)
MTFSVTRRLVAVIVLLTIVGTFATGAARATTPTPESADPCSVPAAGTPATGHGMAGMAMNQEFDLLFIDMMIPHHRSAIAMAEVALAWAEHEEIRTLAQDIIAGQSAEIAQMREWRASWYGDAAAMPMDQMLGTMGGMMQGMPGMEGVDPMAMMGMAMDMSGEVQALCAAPEPFDLSFIAAMIPHHQSAVMMAQVALQNATHQEIRDLAQAIIDAQQREIGEMENWRAEWYGGTPTAG